MPESEAQRRKRLSRAYRERDREMGVYLIRNTVSGKCFVGVSVDIPARFNRHRMNLKFGTEDQQELQRDWLEHGAEAFAFEVAERLEPLDEPGYDPREDLNTLKALWLERVADQNYAYYD